MKTPISVSSSLRCSSSTVEEGTDETLHFASLARPVYRPSLSRRLARLEKQLKLPPEECHRCEAEQKTSEIVTLAAERIRRPVLNGNDNDEELDALELERGVRGETAEGEAGKVLGLKSAWVGRGGLEVGVEQWVLEQWEDKGWKG